MASRRSRVRIPPAPPVESKKLTLENRLPLPGTVAISAVPRAFKQESFTLGEENGYGPLHVIACINAGDGQFPSVNLQFSKNHRPIPIEGATYYLPPGSSGTRTPIKIGKDAGVAHTSLIGIEDRRPTPSNARGSSRPARGYIEIGVARD